MKIWTRILTVMGGLALLAPSTALAQGPDGRHGPEGGPPGAMFDFLGVREAHEGKVVKGAPYKADAVTEITQTLADGNRIARKTTSSVSRDGEGRTRRETNLAALGPLAPHGAPTLVFLQDPVAGTAYVLEPDSRTARKLSMPGPGGKRGLRGGNAAGPEGGPRMKGRFFGRPHEMGEGKWERQTENLGTQTIEGLEATGTRTTVTIPAGAIGNEKAITIVSERWVSPELQAVVLSTHRDPRFGETTYRLTGIIRGEPEKSLFEVPADYTMRAGPPAPMRFPGAPGREPKQ